MNGPWICNKGRDLARIFERARADQPMLKGRPVPAAEALDAARRLIGAARHPVALVSNWGSNEELEAFKRYLGEVFHSHVKRDWQPEEGERIEDDLLIRADKNPNTAKARELFDDGRARLPRRHRPRAGLGRGLRLRAHPAAGEDHLPEFVPRARERPRGRVPGRQHPDRARRALHQLPGRGERGSSRASRRAMRSSTPRRCSRRSRRRRGVTHEPGLRHHASSTSATRSRCCSPSAPSSPGWSASRPRSCRTASAPTAPTCASRSRRSS